MADNKGGRVPGGMSELHSGNYPNATLKGVDFDDVNDGITHTKNASDELLNKVDSLEKVAEIVNSQEATTFEQKGAALLYTLDRNEGLGGLYPSTISAWKGRDRWFNLFGGKPFSQFHKLAEDEMQEDKENEDPNISAGYDQMSESRRLALLLESEGKDDLAKKVRDHRYKRITELTRPERIQMGEGD